MMRYFLVLIFGACCLFASADVIDFENTSADLSLFNYDTGRPTITSNPWSSSIYTSALGVGGSNGVTAVQGNNLISVMYQNPIEIDNGVRTISLDFNFPTLATFQAKVRVGFTGESPGELPGVGSGSTVLFVEPSGNNKVTASLVAIDQTDTIDNYSADSSPIPMSINHWYQMTFSQTIVGDTSTIWGSISDIGVNGTSIPTTIWSDTEAQGLSFPASLMNDGFSYGGFSTDVIAASGYFPLDNFVTPEPSCIFLFGLFMLAGSRRHICGGRKFG